MYVPLLNLDDERIVSVQGFITNKAKGTLQTQENRYTLHYWPPCFYIGIMFCPFLMLPIAHPI